MMPTSITDRDEVLEASARQALATDEAFASFKQLPGITMGVERLTAERGAEYRAIVLAQTPQLLDHLEKFTVSDRIGNASTARYPEGDISPTTWRYIKVLSDLQQLFGSLDGWRVAEIGIGYGGQAKIIGDLFQVASYTIYDLDPVSRLAKKYLQRARSPISAALTIADFRRLGQAPLASYDLVISNWALSECTKTIQDRYIQHVLRRSRHGYITCNQISHLRGIDSYRKREFIDALGFPVDLMPEGLSGIPEEIGNFIVHWSAQPILS